MKRLLASVALVSVFSGCTEPDPVDLNNLIREGDRFVQVPGEPYSGPVFRLHENRQVAMEGTLKDGVFHGPLSAFNEEGQLMVEMNYEEGVESGSYVEYWGNGQRKREAYLVNGEWDGPHRLFSAEGEITSEGRYANGERCGLWLESGVEKTHPPCPDPRQ
ncbi:toxin-antitoxin system YwqK family antitoxin [Gemmatimonadota bacterium]